MIGIILNLVVEPVSDLFCLSSMEPESLVIKRTSVRFTRRFERFRINPDPLNVKIHAKNRTITTATVFTLRQKKGVNAIAREPILVHLCVRK